MRLPLLATLGVAMLAAMGCGGAATTPTTPDVASGPKVDRLVMITTPPARIEIEVRNAAEPNSWPLRPMYDYLVGINNKTRVPRRFRRRQGF
jgi:hypothetical protein